MEYQTLLIELLAGYCKAKGNIMKELSITLLLQVAASSVFRNLFLNQRNLITFVYSSTSMIPIYAALADIYKILRDFFGEYSPNIFRVTKFQK